MKRSISIILVLFAVFFISTLSAEADLSTIGTATYNTLEYNLIYDDDLEITWLDYSNGYTTWDNHVGWASGLNGAEVLTYNLNAGVSMNWSDDWRLPITFDQSCQGYNCTNSEMGHLYYTELGNVGYPIAGYGLSNTGDFQNLLATGYWSGTEYSANPNGAWFFDTRAGIQLLNSKVAYHYAIAVRPGLAVVPEPVSMILFGVGGVVLGARRMVIRRRG